MAKQSINTLKQWFETGDYPTQQQFWDWLDSFFHLDAELQISNIQNLETILESKADASQLAALNNRVVLAAGATQWNVPAGTLVEIIVVLEATEITFKCGTAPGGNDVIEETDFTGNLVYAKNKYFAAATTIYFGGVKIQ